MIKGILALTLFVGCLLASAPAVAQELAWPADQIAALRTILAQVGAQGLDPARYSPAALDGLNGPTRDRVAIEIALRYARALVFGQVDLTTLSHDVDVPRPTVDLPAELSQAIAQRHVVAWLAGLEPRDPQYTQLRAALAHYRERVAHADWRPIPSGAKLQLGKADPRIALLKERLRNEGDLTAADASPAYDAATRAAVMSFQRRHGITPDGVVGATTLDALNISDAQRLGQIVANLERRRFYGHVLRGTRIEVNTAAATATLFRDWRGVLSMRAIVGDRRHPSPMLIGPAVEAIVLNPPWVVPRSIIDHEIAPKLSRQPDCLAKHNMHWSGDQLVQAPGPKNSLGRIKFDFRSSFSVYLHDTPARTLFALDDRARSHGCVRLEKPLDLAMALLQDNPTWSRPRIEAAIAAGKTLRIELRDGPPVVVTYWTVYADPDGRLEFRDDIYGRDARVLAALSAPAASATAAATARSNLGCSPAAD